MQNYTKQAAQAACMFSLLLLIPGCFGGSKKEAKPEAKQPKKTMCKEIDVPISDSDVVKRFFDEEEGQDFLLEEGDDVVVQERARVDEVEAVQDADMQEVAQGDTAFAWAEGAQEIEEESKQDEAFQTVYFAFDGSQVREDQKEALDRNVELVKEKLADASEAPIKVVIDGHACHSAGTDAYNLVISERRARTLRNYLVAKGIPESAITIVGRGSEAPAIFEGQKVSGGRQEQWRNRRGEMSLLYT